jgi:aminoglycoside 3-N-acetyltransferase
MPEKEMVRRLLEAMKVSPDGVVLIHSSFKNLSKGGYRAEAVLEAIVEYMESGTILMPSMSWRGVNPSNPVFDEINTPSITGVLTEIFRTCFATRRSLHPTHSVAGYGPLVDALLATHHLDETPCSLHSPWGLLDNYDARIVLLGVEMDSCTLIHHVEETIAPNLYLQPCEFREQYICRDRNGCEITVYTRRTRRLPRNFWQFEDILAAERCLLKHQIGETSCLGFSAKDLIRVGSERLLNAPDAIIAGPGQRFRMM